MPTLYHSGVRDTELYRQLLGLEKPWTVDRVELDVKQQRVDVWAKHDQMKAWPCPECSKDCGLHDHDEERTWRHLDSCAFQTHLHARVPRVRCHDHGVRQVRVPWAEPTARFTALFERLAIDVLLETSISGATKILGLSWDEAHVSTRPSPSGWDDAEDATTPERCETSYVTSARPAWPGGCCSAWRAASQARGRSSVTRSAGQSAAILSMTSTR